MIFCNLSTTRGTQALMVSLPYRCYIPNSVKVGPVVLEKKILMDGGWLITDDDRLQPNFSDSGDLRSLAVKIPSSEPTGYLSATLLSWKKCSG